MTNEISSSKAQERISEMLTGCSINKVTYYITGWELRFIGSCGPEYVVSASEITLSNINQWQSSVSELPLNIADAAEPDDVITAISIFTVINKWPVIGVEIDGIGNLILQFENGCALCINAVVEQVDWAWQIGTEQFFMITCDSGLIYENV